MNPDASKFVEYPGRPAMYMIEFKQGNAVFVEYPSLVHWRCEQLRQRAAWRALARTVKLCCCTWWTSGRIYSDQTRHDPLGHWVEKWRWKKNMGQINPVKQFWDSIRNPNHHGGPMPVTREDKVLALSGSYAEAELRVVKTRGVRDRPGLGKPKRCSF